MSSVTHDLHQFRYVTSVHHPLPWTHVRHVSIPELRNESPDLPLLANLISGLADCDLSLREIREHNDADILQLAEVLQACLQFALWSQNILKERLLELQSSQVARRVSSRELDHVKSRCRALEKDVVSLTSERDTLSLGTANLRTSLVQLETTIKMQERQLKNERQRTSLLLSKLEKALAEGAPQRSLAAPVAPHDDAVPWQQDAAGGFRCPTCGHRRRTSSSPRLLGVTSAVKLKGAPQRQPSTQSSATSPDNTISDMATSYTEEDEEEDSLLNAEAEFLCQEGARCRRARRRRHHHRSSKGTVESLFPSPCIDWRTLVRYIIHEEKRTPLWPAAHSAAAAPATQTVAASPAVAAAVPPPSLPPTANPAAPIGSVLSPEVSEQLQELFSGFTAAIAGDISEYACSTATQTRDFVTAAAQQRAREMSKQQQSFVKDVIAALRAVPRPASPAAAPPATSQVSQDGGVRFTQSLAAHPAATSPLNASSLPLCLSPVMKSVNAAAAVNLGDARASAVAPSSTLSEVRDTKRSEGYTYGSVYRSHDSSPFGSPSHDANSPSLFGSPVPESQLQSSPLRQQPVSANVLRTNSAGNSRTSLLPTFSADVLRTPHPSSPGTSSSLASVPFSTSNKTEARTTADPSVAVEAHFGGDDDDDDDGQPPDADFRLPTSSSTSRENSYQSSSDDRVRHRGVGGGGGSQAAQLTATAKAPVSAGRLNASFHAPPSARPTSTPPVYPSLPTQQFAVSPLTNSASPGAFSLFRTTSLQSSMRSDASGGSTHASSQMLRDTQRELEALLAEDAAAEQAKKEKVKRS